MFKDPIPQMGLPGDTVVDLIYGLPGISGRETKAVVREMTGEDEEFMAALGERSDLPYPEYLSHLLKRVVLSIGEVDTQKNPSAIDSLIVGDRDLLFLGLIKATYGATRKFTVTCRSCSNDTDLVIDIDNDFPVQGDLTVMEKPLEVTLRDGSTIVLRLPTAEDSRFVSKRGKTVSEQNTLMLSRCAQTSQLDPEAWARALNIGDRRALIDALVEHKVGPQVEEVNDPCPHCGETISVVLDWVSLLFG
jgi:hypothetical protein